MVILGMLVGGVLALALRVVTGQTRVPRRRVLPLVYDEKAGRWVLP
jgi:hypothetical protein